MKPEESLQIRVASYIHNNYPDVIFHHDYGSGAKLTKGQAVKQSKMNAGIKGYPDLFIAEPKDGKYGLFIELKCTGTRLKKLNGAWENKHIANQAEMIERLRFRGYAAYFCVGFEDCVKTIENYLGKPKKEKVEF